MPKPAPNKLRPIIMKDVRIFSKNFAGLPTTFNPAGGKRKFCVFIPDDLLDRMTTEGWNIKHLKPREEDEGAVPRAFIEVEVKFGKYPPRIVMIGSAGKRDLNQTSINLLDWAPAANIDLVINPYEWDVRDNSGVKAYLGKIFYTIYEDELDRKYANVPEDASSSILTDALTEDEDLEDY